MVALFAVFGLAACGGNLSTSDVVKSMEKAGLDIEDVEQLSDFVGGDMQDLFGLDSEAKEEMEASDAVYFHRPGSGFMQFNFIIAHDDEKELKEAKEEMDSSGLNEMGIGSYTVIHKNILLHMTGAISEKEFQEYAKALKKAK